ncbi:MAG: hypothetical protein LQ350_006876 [Teloschistes chrysophthalmus]|nr:MAG: hypothetical protein LQ350_006876 [Niorma chrysophthalma]
MSRHKLVKTMDLDDELDAYDGAHYNDNLDVADEQHLRQGVINVRAVLGPSANVGDKDIEDSLWHYYYDEDKTVNYLLQQQTQVKPKKSLKQNQTSSNGNTKESSSSLPYRMNSSCDMKLSAADFFADAPWLSVPIERRGEILIEPLYPRGGLLGGSPTPSVPKTSKLAALAAARKKKEHEKKDTSGVQSANTSVSLLNKLDNKSHNPETSGAANESTSSKSEITALVLAQRPPKASQPRKYPIRRRESLRAESSGRGASETSATQIDDASDPVPQAQAPLAPTAKPSTFALTVLGRSQDPQLLLAESFESLAFTLPPPSQTNAKTNPFAGPSPDDVVTKAQSSSKGATAAKKSTTPAKDNKATKDLSDSVSDMTFDEGPKPKSKNLDVLAEFEKSRAKRAANFVVIGHVDAGKSTLMGRLLYDLKVVDQRTVDKYRKEAEKIGKSSFALAWVLDQGTEERSRGVTIDIAMNKFETSNTSFTILDAPGHRDFIPNMIAGASQADFAVLVIDASIGNFESGLKGQTKEHALLVRSMGVQRLVVAINKLDSVQWSKDRFDEIQQQLSAFLTTTGFQSKNMSFVPCSGLTGDNIAKRAEISQAQWYTGPILIEQLEASDPSQRVLDKPLRMTISDVFRGGVQNPLSISGRLESGNLQVGDRILAMPANETAVIRSIEIDSEPADWAVGGQNAILHLTEIEAKYLRAGDVICPPSAPIKNVTSITVKVLAFDHITPMHVEVHRGRLHAPGKITRLVAILDKATGAAVGKKKPRLVQPGAVARIVVEMETAVPLEAPDRVILRAGGETLAAGLLEQDEVLWS